MTPGISTCSAFTVSPGSVPGAGICSLRVIVPPVSRSITVFGGTLAALIVIPSMLGEERVEDPVAPAHVLREAAPRVVASIVGSEKPLIEKVYASALALTAPPPVLTVAFGPLLLAPCIAPVSPLLLTVISCAVLTCPVSAVSCGGCPRSENE